MRSQDRIIRYKFHILRKGSDYIAIYDTNSVETILNDLEDQSYIYLDWIRAKDSTVAVRKWQETQKQEVARLKQKNLELQEALEALEKEIEQLGKNRKFNSRHNRTRALQDLSPYEILGLPEGCSDLALIKKKFKSLSMVYHPDKGAGSDEIFKLINSANELLTKK